MPKWRTLSASIFAIAYCNLETMFNTVQRRNLDANKTGYQAVLSSQKPSDEIVQKLDASLDHFGGIAFLPKTV